MSSSRLKILIMHQGSIGDSLVVSPILEHLRKKFPDAHIALYNRSAVGVFPCVGELFAPTGFVDEFMTGSLPKNRIFQMWERLWLLLKLRKEGYDIAVNLHRNECRDPEKYLSRSRRFLRLAGVRRLYGFNTPIDYPFNEPERRREGIDKIGVLLARRLREEMLLDDRDFDRVADLRFTEEECGAARQFWHEMGIPPGTVPVAVGIGGKKAVCRYPSEHYRMILEELVENNRVFPVFFGGEGDREEAAALCRQLNSGAVAPTALPLRKTICLMRFCRMFIGNDTGTIHMAAHAHLRCVGLYAANSFRGLWYPLGRGHRILRGEAECEVCQRTDCDTFPARCIAAIPPEEVIRAAKEILASSNVNSPPAVISTIENTV